MALVTKNVNFYPAFGSVKGKTILGSKRVGPMCDLR